MAVSCMCFLCILLAAEAATDAKVKAASHNWHLKVQDMQEAGSSFVAAAGNVRGKGQVLEAVAPSKDVRPLTDLPTPNICKHHLSGIDDDTLLAALAHKASGMSNRSSAGGLLQQLQRQHIFVAALLHQSEKILPYWTAELVRLLIALRVSGKPANVYVSVYESGSSDRTAEHLHRLEEHLNFMGIPNDIVTGGATRGDRQRIAFLADMRNKAMEPLRRSKESYDRVLWLSDDVFCADGVLQMLAHALPGTKGGLGADAVCGIDYQRGPQNTCEFYDRWAAHDITGNNFENARPFVHVDKDGKHLPGPGEDDLEAGKPFQVFSCWNSMVAFNADIFQKQQLLFRSHRQELGECDVAETELIFRDMWTVGRGKILVSPTAASAYNPSDFEHCAAEKQPIAFNHASPITWKPAPETTNCCALVPNKDYYLPDDCFAERWNRFGDEVPTSQSSKTVVAQHSSTSFLQGDKTVSSNSRVAMLFSETHMAVLASYSYIYHSMFSKEGAEGQVHASKKSGRWSVWSAGAMDLFVVFAFIRLQYLSGGSNNGNHLYTIILFWMCMSLLMNLLNKQCTILFKCPFTLVLIQMLVAIPPLARTPLSGIRKKDLWRWCALALLFGVILCTAMFAFTHASVTYILILRNCLPLLTLPVEKALLTNGPPISVSMVASLLSIAVGSTLYARFSPGFSNSMTGLAWILFNCIASVVHRVCERSFLTSDMTLSFEAMTLINNVVPLLPIGVLAWVTGEIEQWKNYGHLLYSPTAISVILCSGVAGLCLGQSSIMLQKCVSATTMSVLQTMNKMFIITAAMVAFNDRFTPLSFTGCVLSLLGCAAYGMAQQAAKETAVANADKEASEQAGKDTSNEKAQNEASEQAGKDTSNEKAQNEASEQAVKDTSNEKAQNEASEQSSFIRSWLRS